MATATAERTRKREGKKPLLRIVVRFGGVSFGDHTAAVGVKISREKLTVDQAIEYFCFKRLTGRLVVAPVDQDLDQKTFEQIKGIEYEVVGVYDISGVRITDKEISLRASFRLEGLNRDDFSHLANVNGWLVCELVQKIPEEDRPKSEDGQKQFTDGDPLKADIACLDTLNLSILTKLREHGITTVGKLKTLSDAGELSGLLKSKAAEVETALFNFLETPSTGEEDEED